MQRSRGLTLAVFLLVLGSISWGLAGEATTFEQISVSYEVIRQALLHDSSEDVGVAAGNIRRLLQTVGSRIYPRFRDPSVRDWAICHPIPPLPEQETLATLLITNEFSAQIPRPARRVFG